MIKIRNILFTILLVILFVSSLGFSAELPRVAVIGFDSTAPGYIWHINSELSQVATDLMINALIKAERFRVFERIKLDTILKEQDFQAYSGRVDPSTAVKIGKMLGVDLIVTGSVTSILYQKSGGIKLGPVSLKKSSASVTMTVRAINVTSGEIIFSEVKKGTTSKSGVSIRIPVAGGFGMSSESVTDIFSAIEDVCLQTATEFVVKAEFDTATASSLPLEGYVVKVESTSSGEITQVYINLGEDSGIQVGDEIKIFQEGEVILDPKTNEVLDRELDLIAQARITDVKEKLSIALVTTKFSNTDIMPTDIVEVIR
ncbi:MAG: CsgG/HfaB family protein [Atribacterota bacterium]|nr:CsgG/HfaB family protein [Atribacterota bacterium]